MKLKALALSFFLAIGPATIVLGMDAPPRKNDHKKDNSNGFADDSGCREESNGADIDETKELLDALSLYDDSDMEHDGEQSFNNEILIREDQANPFDLTLVKNSEDERKKAQARKEAQKRRKKYLK